MRHRRAALAGVIAVALAVSGCSLLPGAAGEQRLTTGAPAVRLNGVAFYPDNTILCGPSTLAAALNWAGRPAVRPADLTDALIIPDRDGALQAEMLATTRRQGRLPWVIPPDLGALGRELAAGRPAVVLQNLALDWWPRWHYAVVTARDPATDTMWLNTGLQQGRAVDATVFDRTWARSGRWGMVVLAPGVLPATGDPRGLLRAIHALERVAGPGGARPYWRAAAARWPADGRLAVALANTQEAMGDADAALATLEQASASAREGRGVVLNNLAVLLAERGALDRAEALAREAVALPGRHRDAARETLESIRCRQRVDCQP